MKIVDVVDETDMQLSHLIKLCLLHAMLNKKVG